MLRKERRNGLTFLLLLESTFRNLAPYRRSMVRSTCYRLATMGFLVVVAFLMPDITLEIPFQNCCLPSESRSPPKKTSVILSHGSLDTAIFLWQWIYWSLLPCRCLIIKIKTAFPEPLPAVALRNCVECPIESTVLLPIKSRYLVLLSVEERATLFYLCLPATTL
jgi:hypothetical protein